MNKNNLNWTQQAIDCFEIGCRCSKCFINKNIESKCLMKSTVIELVRRFGKPKPIEKKEDKFNLDDIKKWLYEGFTIREIAKKYHVDVRKLREFIHAHGLQGRKLYAFKKKGGTWTL